MEILDRSFILTSLKAPVLKGGIKPRNDFDKSNPPYKNLKIKYGQNASSQNTFNNKHNKTGNTATTHRQPQEKPFGLQWAHDKLDDQDPRKRRKTSETQASHNGSSQSPIDLERESTNSSRRMGPPASRSGLSQTGKAFSSKGVEEYHKAEDQVRFNKKRKSNSSSSQTLNGHASQRFLPQSQSRLVGKLDDADASDPISEDEIPIVTNVRHVKKTASRTSGTPSVEVPVPRQTESTTGYQGSAKPEASRKKTKVWANDDVSQAQEENEQSNHLQPTQPHPRKQNSSGSHLADDINSSRGPVRSLGTLNSDSGTYKASSRKSSPHSVLDVSLDELTSDSPNQQVASALLAKHKNSKLGVSKPKGSLDRKQSDSVDLVSDDDLALENANIPKTNFVSSKTAQDKTDSKNEVYTAILAFSETDPWLVNENEGPWSLVHNAKSKSMKLSNRSRSFIWELLTKKVEKIEYNDDSPILVIHKARDHTTGSGTHVYLKLVDSDQSNDLRESLKTSQPTIQPLKKPE